MMPVCFCFSILYKSLSLKEVALIAAVSLLIFCTVSSEIFFYQARSGGVAAGHRVLWFWYRQEVQVSGQV